MNAFLRLAGAGVAVLFLSPTPGASASPAPDYTVVISRRTAEDAAWMNVAKALQAGRRASLLVFETNVTETLPDLRRQFPRHACFVAQPAEATREFVARVHRLMRQLDEDPYCDCFWGILIGYNPANALRIAQHREPLTVRKVASGTEIALECCEEGLWHCELTEGKRVRKQRGSPPVQERGPADSTEALVQSLNQFAADCFVTSGHATERDWQIGYRYRGGTFRCGGGGLYGLDTQGRRFPVQSPNPKVYLPIGNCLMGHIDSREAMALAFMNSAGVHQMLGYTVPSWYGYAGWGCLDYFLEQPGRYSFTEAFFANQAALIHRIESFFPESSQARADSAGRQGGSASVSDLALAEGLTAADARGLVFDRDVVAFYGDPAWEARLAEGPRRWEQTLAETNGTWFFSVKPSAGEKTFQPVNRNGSQRGGRPIVQFLPRRIGKASLLEGQDLKPVITDDFILVPNPRKCDPARAYRVVFSAAPRT